MGTSLISQVEGLEKIPDETVVPIPSVHEAIGREVPERKAFLCFSAPIHLCNYALSNDTLQAHRGLQDMGLF